MADELHGISSSTSPQDVPIDHAVTQPLQVNIQVPDTVNAQRSNCGACCTCLFSIPRFYCYICYLIIIVPLMNYIILPLLEFLDII